MEPPFRLLFKLRFADLAKFNFWVVFTNPLTMVTAAFPTAVVVAFLLLDLPTGPKRMPLVFLGAMLAFLGTLALMAFSAIIAVWLHKKAEIQAEQNLTINEHQISGDTPHSSICVDWDAVRKVKVKPSVIYLFVSSSSALIIPRSAFSDGADWQSFQKFCLKQKLLRG